MDRQVGICLSSTRPAEQRQRHPLQTFTRTSMRWRKPLLQVLLRKA